MVKKKGFQVVYIEWCDAARFNSQWVNLDEAVSWAQTDDWIIRQTGFVIKETNKFLLLAASVNPQHSNDVKVDGLLKIPKTWIRKRTTLANIKITS